MLNATLFRTTLCFFLVSATPLAQPLAGELAPAPDGSTTLGQFEPDGALPPPAAASALLADIANWVSENFDIPASAILPRIEIAFPERFATVRYRRLVEGQQGGSILELRDEPPSNQFGDVVAFYENASQTIFLREGWTGRTPQDVSVLVHEMVHHLQNIAGFKYACPAEREKSAYAAQQEWLEFAGHDFFESFATDRMTLLVRTTCGL